MFARVTRKWMLTACLIGIACLLAGSVFAASTGRIKGTVVDKKTGEPLIGASVSIEGTTRGAKTDFDGNYIINSVPPGEYNLHVSAVGYGEVKVEQVIVNADQTSENNVQLEQQVLDIGMEVTVKAQRDVIDVNQTGTVSIKRQEEIQRAPVASVDDLLSRETGITRDPEGELHVRGGRAGETVYLVDGVDYSDPLGGRAPVDAGINISSSAVLELQVIKDGFDPEYGEALSGVVKITSPEGSPQKTRARVTYYTDDFGSANLNTYSENYDDLDFSLSGPDPVLTNKILPAIGINYFRDKDFTYYVYGRTSKTDTQNPYNDYVPVENRLVLPEFDLLGIQVPDRQNNVYNLDATLAYDPTQNMHAKLLFKGTWNNGIKFNRSDWIYRYTPQTAPVYEYNTATVSVQLKQILSKTTDYELNISYWGSRYEQKPGDPHNPGRGLDPDQFLIDSLYEYYNDLNSNNQYDPYEPLINIFPDSIQWGEYWIPNRNGADVLVSTDEQYGGFWFPMYDFNGNGIIDNLEGEPFIDLNNNGIWDAGDKLETDVNGNRTWDDAYEDVTSSNWTDREEPYVDGDSSLGEPFIDVNNNGVYDQGVDGFIISIDPAVNMDLNYNSEHDGPDAPWSQGVPYIDFNGNGVFDQKNNLYDPGEPYVDVNKNGKHDAGNDKFLNYGYAPQTVWSQEQVDKYTIKGNFKKAIGRAHEVKAGFEYRIEQVYVGDIRYLQQPNDVPDDFPFSERGLRDFYRREPHILVLYFRDKIEYGSLVASLGLRADLFFQANLKNVTTVTELLGDQLRDVTSKFSPRVSINYPISERAMIRFNYGHFYELPSYTELYRNANPLAGTGIPLLGNPNLDYTKVINYTFGVNYAFSDEYSLKISGFYKDYFDIINVSFFGSGASERSYYDNTDYARVRGVEMELEREASRFINGTLSYEYTFAYGKSSSTSANYEQRFAGGDISIEENPLSWDIRHRVSLWLQLYFSDRDHPNLFGITLPSDWDLSVYWRFQTGFPFTPSKDYPGMTLDVGEEPSLNSLRLPSTAFTDIKFHKRFRAMGMQYTFQLWVKNLFNNENVVAVYQSTGRPDTSQNQSKIVKGGSDYDQNPRNWGRGREVIVGLALSF
jgi:outer membrane receptor protein involved in Fe transport